MVTRRVDNRIPLGHFTDQNSTVDQVHLPLRFWFQFFKLQVSAKQYNYNMYTISNLVMCVSRILHEFGTKKGRSAVDMVTHALIVICSALIFVCQISEF